jgi:hypothetical protein
MNLIARTGQKDIDSNKRKSALVNFPVRATEHALHESHVRIDERQTYHLARFGIGLRHHAADVRQSDEALRFVIVMGSASMGSNAAGPNTW